MVRTRKVDDRPRWKNTGGGTLLLADKRLIRPGDIFHADPKDISKAFRDTIIPLDDVEKPEPVAVAVKYTLRARGGNWYDIVDKEGKVVNTKSLRRVEAEEMIKSLEG